MRLPRRTPHLTRSAISSMLQGISGTITISAPQAKRRVQGDVAAVAAHDGDEAGALVGIAGLAHAVDALAGGVQGGVKADGVIGIGQVVVDGARHADGGDAQRR